MIVADAGPLISLARIDRLSLLPAIFGRVWVAPRVYAEITVEGAPGAHRLTGLAWLSVRAPADLLGGFASLDLWAQRGEGESILLATELEAPILIDDRRGRELARLRGLPVTGTVGAVLAAKLRGLIPSVRPVLLELEAAGAHLGPRLTLAALRQAGESDSGNPGPSA